MGPSSTSSLLPGIVGHPGILASMAFRTEPQKFLKFENKGIFKNKNFGILRRIKRIHFSIEETCQLNEN